MIFLVFILTGDHYHNYLIKTDEVVFVKKEYDRHIIFQLKNGNRIMLDFYADEGKCKDEFLKIINKLGIEKESK